MLVYLMRSRDSFKDLLSSSAPRFCGSSNDGYSQFTPGYLEFLKKSGIGGHWNITAKTKVTDFNRLYTESDCDSLDTTHVNNTCVEFKSDASKNPDGSYKIILENIKNNYGEKCKKLNEQSSPIRPECKVDDVVVGKQINAFTIKVKGKQVNMPGNALRVYTEDECKDLGGNAASVIGNIISNLIDESKVGKADIKKFTDQVMGEDGNEEYFLCQGSIPFSTVCIDGSSLASLSSLTSSLPSFSDSSSSSKESSSDSSFFGDIAESAKTRLKEWLGI